MPMTSDNTGWQSPSGDGPTDGASHDAGASPSAAPGPRYGAYAPQPERPGYDQQAESGGYSEQQPPAYGQYQQTPAGQGYGPAPQYGQYSQYNQPAGDYYAAGPGGFFAAPKPGIIPLRPLSITEIIGGAFESLRANPRAMFLPSLLVMGAAGLFSALMAFIFRRSLISLASADYYNDYDPTVSQAEAFNATLSLLGGTLTGTMLEEIITLLATAVLTGLLTVTVSRSVLGRIATPTDVWERTRPRIWALIGQSILVNLITTLTAVLAVTGVGLLFAGMFYTTFNSDGSGNSLVLLVLLGFLLMVGGVIAAAFLGVRLSVAGAALILENVSVWEGIRRSWQLTRGSFWRVLGTLLLSAMLVSAVSALISFPLGMVTGVGGVLAGGTVIVALDVLVTFATFLVSAVIMPFSAAVVALIYIDLRMRREGLDVELRRSANV
ncbi:glycerophosphodiester phosphodiesterase [Actinomyces sp. Z3]|nr:glycerophosphodiester phosphodiesterase [Actinomyces sp. Z3]